MTKLTFKYATKLYATIDRDKNSEITTLPVRAIVDSDEDSAQIRRKMGNRDATLEVVAMGLRGYVGCKWVRFASGEAESE